MPFQVKKCEVPNVDSQLTLSTFLRKSLHLTGTKIGCGVSGCGSCTVTISRKNLDGNLKHYSANACSIKLWTLHGTHVTTIEGIGMSGPQINGLQDRLHKKHGVQCGFCSPGMIMSVHSKVQSGDIEDVSKCLQGNLCRCTGYRAILDAFKDVKDLGKEEFKPICEVIVPDNVPSLNVKNQLFAPQDLNEAIEIMMKYKGRYELINGGTGTYQMPPKDPKDVLIHLGNVKELQTVNVEKDKIVIGAGVKLADLKSIFDQESWLEPFSKALETLASPQVRNQATIGGSIMWTHPASDLWPLYQVFDCHVQVKTVDPLTKTFKMEELPADFDGLLTGLVIMRPPKSFNGTFMKKARRKEFDLALLNMAALADIEDEKVKEIKVAFGGSISLFRSNSGQRGLATSTVEYLKGKNIADISDKDLINAIDEDLQTEDKSLHNLKLTSALFFIKSFLKGSEVRPKMNEVTSTQLFQNVPEDQDENDLLHRPISHRWGDELACGTATFVDDLKSLPDEHVLVLIRSDKAHAKIKKLDLAEALKNEGILGAITASDVVDNQWGLMINDEPVLAGDKVEYHGQVIAGLVCKNKESGEKALEKVIIEYEDLPFVLNIKHAKEVLDLDLANQEVILAERIVERKQDLSLIEETNDTAKIQGVLRMGGVEHFYMEPNSVLAMPGEKEELIVHHSTQEVTPTQKQIARVTGVPMHKIIVKNKRAGGGFGGKERMHIALMACVAAKKFKKPIRLVFTRKEDISLTGQRHESLVNYEILVDKNSGKILDASFEAFVNGGVSCDLSYPWMALLLFRIDSGYTFKNFKGVGRVLKTNSPSNTAFRGFGGPEGAFYIESIMDRICYDLNLSPLKVREVNMSTENDLLHHGESRLKICTIKRCWQACLEQSQYESKVQAANEFNQSSSDIKKGLAVIPMKFVPGLGAYGAMRGSALVRVYSDGSVLLTHGGIEMGQGLHTKMIQVASRTLKINPDLIHINEVSTETLANTSPTGGSCGTDLNGPAVQDACEKIKERVKPYQESNPSGSWADWVQTAIEDRVCLTVVGHYDTSPLNYDWNTDKGDYYAYFTYGACAVEVEVNCQTGDVTVMSADLVMDLGKSLNPAIDIGQVEGAFVMGLGSVTTEQLTRDLKTGQLLTDGPSFYKIPTVADVPRKFNVTLLENNEPGPQSAIYSSKGVGEPPIVASAAVVMAIKDAIRNFRKSNGLQDWFPLEPPCTPEKISMVASGKTVSPKDLTYVEM